MKRESNNNNQPPPLEYDSEDGYFSDGTIATEGYGTPDDYDDPPDGEDDDPIEQPKHYEEPSSALQRKGARPQRAVLSDRAKKGSLKHNKHNATHTPEYSRAEKLKILKASAPTPASAPPYPGPTLSSPAPTASKPSTPKSTPPGLEKQPAKEIQKWAEENGVTGLKWSALAKKSKGHLVSAINDELLSKN